MPLDSGPFFCRGRVPATGAGLPAAGSTAAPRGPAWHSDRKCSPKWAAEHAPVTPLPDKGLALPLDWYERYRHILRHDPDGVEKVIRAIRYLRDKATTGKDDIKRELAFSRKNRHRMRYRQLKDQSLPIGSGVVEAANKVLVTQRLKRSGMRWKIDSGRAVLTFRALIKSDRFDTAWKILMASITGAANDNQDTTAATIAA